MNKATITFDGDDSYDLADRLIPHAVVMVDIEGILISKTVTREHAVTSLCHAIEGKAQQPEIAMTAETIRVGHWDFSW